MEYKAIHEKLVEKFGAAVLALDESGVEPHCDIEAGQIAAVAQYLRDEPDLDFDSLMCLTGIDWDGYDEAGKGKSVAILGYNADGTTETSDRVAEGDFGVVYNLYSHARMHKFTLRVRVPRDVAEVPTVGLIWPTAQWHEREAWDLVGIRFAGHPDLRRILLEETWEGHPLRKDYQMPDQWEGVPLAGRPYSDDTRPRPPASAEGSGAGESQGQQTGDER
jgi:NADH-quinone oxidoreductase subunit C